MNKGKSLMDLASEIERQYNSKQDYLAPSSKLRMMPDGRMGVDLGKNVVHLVPNQLAHNQIAEKLGIPKLYYDKMLSKDTDLLSHNVNTWFDHDPDQVRMVRTIDETMRCMVSDKYRPLDYFDLANMALPVLKDLRLEVRSSDLTDTRMYLKAVLPNMTAEIKRGQVIAWGIWISNSEVGAGALDLAGFSEILACTNGAKHESVFRRNHVGGRSEVSGEFAQEFYSNETKKASDKALWLQFRDTLKGILSDDHFGQVVDKMKDSLKRDMENPVKTISVVVKKFGLSVSDGQSLFRHLNAGREFNQYGLVNAVTRYAEDQKDYDKSSELETLGGKLLDLTDEGWQAIEAEKVGKKDLVLA